MKKILFFLFFPLLGVAQNGPGGVGSSKGNSSLVLWLNAGYIVQGGGSPAAIWLDNSGFENHAITEVGKGPLLLGNSVNNQNTFQFTPNEGGIFQVHSSQTISSENLSLFVVGKINKENPAWAGFLLKSGSDWNEGYGLGRDNEENTLTTNYKKNGLEASFEFGKYFITSLHHNSIQAELWKNGKLNDIENNPKPLKENTGTLDIGWTGDYLDGEIAEIIILNESATLIEKQLITNYLSSKYNIPLEEGDIYLNDTPERGNFDFDLAGIGMAEDMSEVLSAKGSGIVSLKSTKELNVNEYLLWANNGVKQDELTEEDLPKGVEARLGREWRVGAVNYAGESVDIGGVDVLFDLSLFNKINPEEVVLLIDANNDVSYGNEIPLENGILVDGNHILFKNVTTIKDDVRFTLGSINKERVGLSPLVADFELNIIDNSVVLSWGISSLEDVKSFIVEKTDDSHRFKTMQTVLVEGEETKFSVKDVDLITGYSNYRLLKVNDNRDTTLLETRGFDSAHALKKYKEQKKEDERLALTQKITRIESESTNEKYGILVIIMLLLIVVGVVLRLRYSKNIKERTNLLNEIEILKYTKESRQLLDIEPTIELKLNKEKVQLSVESKLNETDWKILNIVFDNPVIVNKEIAEGVSLSVEGVSSSLRKMYRLFEIDNSKNKKMALVMQAAKISRD